MVARLNKLAFVIACVLLCSQCSRVEESPPPVDAGPKKAGIFRIAFGSCAKQDRPQTIWRSIVNSRPDVWVWLGDAIYADRKEDLASMERHYQLQRANAGYQLLLKSVPVVLGTWDDNDYGSKDKGKSFEKKVQSQRLYLDFLGEPRDSPRRQQEGVYWSYLLGEKERQVHLILLDVQYHCDSPGPESDVLGERQWAWVEKELRETHAQVNLIFSGMQIIASEHAYDKWANHPKSRQRLLTVIRESKTPGVILVSGDRHLGEISRMESSETPYPLYDVTSSGLTHHVDWIWHSRNLFLPEKNHYRLGQQFTERNFGVIDIDWTTNPAQITLEVRDEKNGIRLAERVELSRLQPAWPKEHSLISISHSS